MLKINRYSETWLGAHCFTGGTGKLIDKSPFHWLNPSESSKRLDTEKSQMPHILRGCSKAHWGDPVVTMCILAAIIPGPVFSLTLSQAGVAGPHSQDIIQSIEAEFNNVYK